MLTSGECELTIHPSPFYLMFLPRQHTCLLDFVSRYRVSPRLFRRIADAVTAFDNYFQEKENNAGKTGANPYQKILACFKMLATGLPPLAFEREFGISKTVLAESLKRFVWAVVTLFEAEYLRAPNQHDIESLLQVAETRGFPGMIGSIDCMLVGSVNTKDTPAISQPSSSKLWQDPTCGFGMPFSGYRDH